MLVVGLEEGTAVADLAVDGRELELLAAAGAEDELGAKQGVAAAAELRRVGVHAANGFYRLAAHWASLVASVERVATADAVRSGLFGPGRPQAVSCDWHGRGAVAW